MATQSGGQDHHGVQSGQDGHGGIHQHDEHEMQGSLPIFSRQGARASLRLNRPHKHNRIEPVDLVALHEHLLAIDNDPSVGLLVLTGSGSKSFSSGYSLNALETGTVKLPEQAGDRKITLESVVNQLEDLRVPTICALNGSVYGAGTDFALACDFRIGVSGTVMLMPAAKIGVHYYAHGMRRYVERLGLGAAKRLFMAAQKIDCDEMLRIGFLDRLVEPGGLDHAVDALADSLEVLAPAAVRGMKRDLNQIARGQFDAARMNRAYDESLQSADLVEGLAALAAKRRPDFPSSH